MITSSENVYCDSGEWSENYAFSEMMAMSYDKVKCNYCGRWGDQQTECKGCGATLDKRTPEFHIIETKKSGLFGWLKK